MPKILTKITKDLLHAMGYRLLRTSEAALGQDPFQDMLKFLGDRPDPVVIDAGGNTGQSVEWFRRAMPASIIHTFEPSPSTFAELEKNIGRYDNVTANRCGLGREAGELEFRENSDPTMSSFLLPGETAWGEVVSTVNVPVTTVDAYAGSKGISFIDVLKLDTQGYELEVLRGAASLLREGRIHLIFAEVLFSEQYQGTAPGEEVLLYLRNHGFRLVTIYEQFYQQDALSWTDILFRKTETAAGRSS